MKLSELSGNTFVKQDGTTECSICLDNLTKEDELVQRVCNHVFHEACDKLWKESDIGRTQGCPLCRSEKLLTSDEMLEAFRASLRESRKKGKKYSYLGGYSCGTLLTAVPVGLLVLNSEPSLGAALALGYMALSSYPGFKLGGKLAALLQRFKPPEDSPSGAFNKGLIDSVFPAFFGMVSTAAALALPLYAAGAFNTPSE